MTFIKLNNSLTRQWHLQGDRFCAVDPAMFLEVTLGVETFPTSTALVRPITQMSAFVNRQSAVGGVSGIDNRIAITTSSPASPPPHSPPPPTPQIKKIHINSDVRFCIQLCVCVCVCARVRAILQFYVNL